MHSDCFTNVFIDEDECDALRKRCVLASCNAMIGLSFRCDQQGISTRSRMQLRMRAHDMNKGLHRSSNTRFAFNARCALAHRIVEKTFHVCGKIVEKMLHYVASFIQILGTKVVLSTDGRSCHGVTGIEARSTVLLRRTFCIDCRVQVLCLLLQTKAPCDNQVFGFFGGCIRGQEESWSNEEEGSQEEGC
jgi:hypothetical protein